MRVEITLTQNDCPYEVIGKYLIIESAKGEIDFYDGTYKELLDIDRRPFWVKESSSRIRAIIQERLKEVICNENRRTDS